MAKSEVRCINNGGIECADIVVYGRRLKQIHNFDTWVLTLKQESIEAEISHSLRGAKVSGTIGFTNIVY